MDFKHMKASDLEHLLPFMKIMPPSGYALDLL